MEKYEPSQNTPESCVKSLLAKVAFKVVRVVPCAQGIYPIEEGGVVTITGIIEKAVSSSKSVGNSFEGQRVKSFDHGLTSAKDLKEEANRLDGYI